MAASDGAERRGKWTLVGEDGNIQGSDSDIGSASSSSDCVAVDENVVHFRSKRVNSRSSTGSGCTPHNPCLSTDNSADSPQNVASSSSWLGNFWASSKTGPANSNLSRYEAEETGSLPSVSQEENDTLDTASLESIEVLPMPSDSGQDVSDHEHSVGQGQTTNLDPVGPPRPEWTHPGGVTEALCSSSAVTLTDSLSSSLSPSRIEDLTSSSSSSQLDFLMVDRHGQGCGATGGAMSTSPGAANAPTNLARMVRSSPPPSPPPPEEDKDQVEQAMGTAGPLPVMPPGALALSSVSVDNIPRGVEAQGSPRRAQSEGNIPQQDDEASLGIPIMTQRWPTEDGGFLLVQQFRGDGEPAMSRSSSFSDLSSSFSYPGVRRRIPNTGEDTLRRQSSSDTFSEDVTSPYSGDTSTDDALPANMTVSGMTPGVRQYLHQRDESLNSKLTMAALVVVVAAMALVLGHYIGSSQATTHHLGIEAGQVWRLRSLQDQLVTCLDKTRSLLRGAKASSPSNTQTKPPPALMDSVPGVIADSMMQDPPSIRKEEEEGLDTLMTCSMCSGSLIYSEFCNSHCNIEQVHGEPSVLEDAGNSMQARCVGDITGHVADDDKGDVSLLKAEGLPDLRELRKEDVLDMSGPLTLGGAGDVSRHDNDYPAILEMDLDLAESETLRVRREGDIVESIDFAPSSTNAPEGNVHVGLGGDFGGSNVEVPAESIDELRGSDDSSDEQVVQHGAPDRSAAEEEYKSGDDSDGEPKDEQTDDNIMGKLSSKLSNSWFLLRNLTTDFVESASNLSVNNVTSQLKENVQTLRHQIKDAVSSLQKSNITSKVKDSVHNLGDQVKDVVSNIQTGNFSSIKEAVQGVSGTISGAMSAIQKSNVTVQMKEGLQDLGNTFQRAMASLKEEGAKIKEPLKKGVKSVKDILRGTLHDDSKREGDFTKEKRRRGCKRNLKSMNEESKEESTDHHVKSMQKKKKGSSNKNPSSESRKNRNEMGKRHKHGDELIRNENQKRNERKDAKKEKNVANANKNKIKNSKSSKLEDHINNERVTQTSIGKGERQQQRINERREKRNEQYGQRNAEDFKTDTKRPISAPNNQEEQSPKHHSRKEGRHPGAKKNDRKENQGHGHHRANEDDDTNKKNRDQKGGSRHNGENYDNRNNEEKQRFADVNWEDLLDSFDMRCHGVKDCLRKQRTAALKLYQELLDYRDWLKARCYKKHLEELKDFMEELEEFLAEPSLRDEDLDELMEDFEDMAEDLEEATLKNFRRFMKNWIPGREIQESESGRHSKKHKAKHHKKNEDHSGNHDETLTVTLDLKPKFNFSDVFGGSEGQEENVDESAARKHAGYGYQSNDDWFIRRMHNRENLREHSTLQEHDEGGREGEGGREDEVSNSNWYAQWMRGREEGRVGLTVWDLYQWFSKRQALRHEWRIHEMDDHSNWFLRRP